MKTSVKSKHQPSHTAYSSRLCPWNSSCRSHSGAWPLPLHVSPSGERYLTLTEVLLFRGLRDGTTSLRLSPRSLIPLSPSQLPDRTGTPLFPPFRLRFCQARMIFRRHEVLIVV